MKLITIRHNFETNSSSMHSLAIRNEGEIYTADENIHSAMNHVCPMDCFLITNVEGRYTQDELWDDACIWPRKNGAEEIRVMHMWSHDFLFHNEAMMVLSTFMAKFRYLVAAFNESAYEEYRKPMKKAHKNITKLLEIARKTYPGVKIELPLYGYGRRLETSINGITKDSVDVLNFLRKKNISIEDFLTMKKYVVIVNYPEYQNMKFLNMVDENIIQEEWVAIPKTAQKVELDADGVWNLSPRSLDFGRYPFRVLGTPESKARYALAVRGCENIQEVTDILKEVIPGLTGITRPIGYFDEVDCGYSESNLIGDIPLKDFILNKKYVIISDGDEYCVYDEFTQAGLRNLKAYPLTENEKRKYSE